MISRLLLTALLLFTGCSNRLKKEALSDIYHHVIKVPEDSRELKKEISRSKATLHIDFETGNFSGKYKKNGFSGKYRMEHVAAGFVKGFFYRISLENMHHPAPGRQADSAFMAQLSAASRLYVAPNRLTDSPYTLLEITAPGSDTKMIWVKLKAY